MQIDIYSVLELCGICALTFWCIGFVMLLVAVRNARREFRVKGYLRPPSGRGWLRFLLWKQYDHFEDPSTRFFFGIVHFCLMATLVSVMAVVVLLGSEQLFKSMSGLPEGGAGLPRITLPK